ncbi:MAG: PAS domain-containing sensor histidine kinase [Anaerolineales bacterium]
MTDKVKVHPVYEPDEDRRRSLFSVLLVAILVLCVPVFFYTILEIYFGNAMPKIDLGFETDSLKQLAIATGSMSVLAFVAFLLNRAKKLPALRVAAAVFILAVTVFIFLSDTPEEVISGRTSFVLLVPIFLASVLVYPASGVIVAFLEMLAFLLIAPEHLSINNFSLALIYFFAIICWVSAHSAESAIATALREGTKSKTIFASTADGLVVFDVNGKVMQINGAGLKMLSGKEPAELLQATNRTESQNGAWKIELENGRTLAVTKAPMLEENRNVGTVLGLRDFTREAAVERMQKAIIGVVSHELRTPAAVIKGIVDLLQSQKRINDTETAQAIENIGRNIQRLLLLINDLLDRASLESGTLKLVRSPFSIASLIGKVKDIAIPLLEDKDGKVDLCFIVDDALPRWMLGDVNRLWQVMTNLVNNGIKFTDSGTVKVSLYPCGRTHWIIEVSDTGIGIPETVLEFIFEPLRRGPDFAVRRHQGAGLGLSITKELVNLMGGSIEVKSKAGEGSTFRVKLPMEKAV